jgi:hypothetical protein
LDLIPEPGECADGLAQLASLQAEKHDPSAPLPLELAREGAMNAGADNETLRLRGHCGHARRSRRFRRGGRYDCENGRLVKSLAALESDEDAHSRRWRSRGDLSGREPVCAQTQSLRTIRRRNREDQQATGSGALPAEFLSLMRWHSRSPSFSQLTIRRCHNSRVSRYRRCLRSLGFCSDGLVQKRSAAQCRKSRASLVGWTDRASRQAPHSVHHTAVIVVRRPFTWPIR